MALYTLHLFVQFDEWGLERSSHSRPRGGTILFTFAGFARHSAWPASLGGHARPNACPLFSDQFFLLLLVFSSNEMFGLASCLLFFYESSLSPVGTEPRSHMAPPLPEASVHFKRFVNPSLSLFLPSEDDGRTDRARPLIFPSTPLPVPAARPRARLETPTPPLPRTAGASGATCDGVGDSSSKYRRNSVFSVTQ